MFRPTKVSPNTASALTSPRLLHPAEASHIIGNTGAAAMGLQQPRFTPFPTAIAMEGNPMANLKPYLGVEGTTPQKPAKPPHIPSLDMQVGVSTGEDWRDPGEEMYRVGRERIR